ncbi:MAG: hypothetical protein Q8O30_12985 [Candidatus Omnitrophota bacterium]|nr:hypothetical protein [Candidatus Omnitrophota bacterium]
MDLQIIRLDPAKEILVKLGGIGISALKIIIILLFGWIVAKIIKRIVVRVLKAVKINELSERVNLNNLLLKGGISSTVSDLLGAICYWVIILVTLSVAVDAVGLNKSADLIEKVVRYVAVGVVPAIFFLIVSMFAATLLSNIVKTAANNAGISQASLLGKIAQVVVMAFAIAVSLIQLRIASNIITLLITILLGALGLGLALAFGLGCKDIVAKYVEGFIDNIKSKK